MPQAVRAVRQVVDNTLMAQLIQVMAVVEDDQLILEVLVGLEL